MLASKPKTSLDLRIRSLQHSSCFWCRVIGINSLCSGFCQKYEFIVLSWDIESYYVFLHLTPLMVMAGDIGIYVFRMDSHPLLFEQLFG